MMGSTAHLERLAFERSKSSISIEIRWKTEGRPPDAERYIDLVVRRCRIFYLCDCGQVMYLAEIFWTSKTGPLWSWWLPWTVILLIISALTSALFNKGHRGEGAGFNLEKIIILAPNYRNTTHQVLYRCFPYISSNCHHTMQGRD